MGSEPTTECVGAGQQAPGGRSHPLHDAPRGLALETRRSRSPPAPPLYNPSPSPAVVWDLICGITRGRPPPPRVCSSRKPFTVAPAGRASSGRDGTGAGQRTHLPRTRRAPGAARWHTAARTDPSVGRTIRRMGRTQPIHNVVLRGGREPFHQGWGGALKKRTDAEPTFSLVLVGKLHNLFMARSQPVRPFAK